MTPQEAFEWMRENMLPYYPLGVYQDVEAEGSPMRRGGCSANGRCPSPRKVEGTMLSDDLSIVLAGFGGQGVLFAGKVIAYAGLMEDREVSWLPSYGPEMRGGTANCSVCLSDRPHRKPARASTPMCSWP